jgi:tetratricopeptide (TPR) repeat protein
MALLLCFGGKAQVEELTPEEQAYRDSITALNLENQAVANSQEAYNKGIAFFSEKKFNEAIKEFEKSIGFDNNFTAAYYNKGVAEIEAGKFDAALKSLGKLIELKAGYSKAYFQRGRAYQGLNDYVNSEKDYEKSIQLDAGNPKAYYNFATF